jgi:hypothetical protein
MPRCKNCKEKFTSNIFLMKYCSKDECIKKFVESTKQKEWIVKKSKLKADLMTVQDYVKIAQTHFNNYIRKRDEGLNCISCDKPPLKKNAGHYYNANNHWNVRFDEDNVHLQCEHCNTHLSGNLINYRENLINKIGIKKFTQLSLISNITAKYSINELKEITEYYKNKIKNL